MEPVLRSSTLRVIPAKAGIQYSAASRVTGSPCQAGRWQMRDWPCPWTASISPESAF